MTGGLVERRRPNLPNGSEHQCRARMRSFAENRHGKDGTAGAGAADRLHDARAPPIGLSPDYRCPAVKPAPWHMLHSLVRKYLPGPIRRLLTYSRPRVIADALGEDCPELSSLGRSEPY